MDPSSSEGYAKGEKAEKISLSDERPPAYEVGFPSGIEDGLLPPTEEEKDSLRRVADTIPWNAFLIAFIELAERFSYYGSSVVFTNFIQQSLPPGSHTGAGFKNQSGALGLGQRASTGLTTFFQFWCYVTPLFGAWVADTHLGRYNTIAVALAIALVGHVILIVSALPGVIEHKSAVGAFSVAIIIMGLGTGMFKSNISPLIAEQCYRKSSVVTTTKKGERVIIDPVMTVSRVFMYFYLFVNIGALVGQIGMSYSEKYVGFWLAYTLPTVVFLLCPMVLWIGRNRYVRTPPTGSVYVTAFRLWRFASKGRWSLNPVRTWKQMTADDFWENAKPSQVVARSGEAGKPKWMVFNDQWVDEVRRGLKACGVFCWIPLWWLTYNQINNNLTSQAATMETNGIPNDVLSNLDPLALMILIPLCDLFIYPAFHRMGLKFTALKKIAWGFAVGTASMIWAAVVQHYIYKTNQCHYYASTCQDANQNPIVSPLNVWIQTGSYVLIALSEIFASITGLEYAFTKAPVNMRSCVMAVFLFTSAISSAIGEAFVSVSADPLLVWNYGSMAAICGISGAFFWLSVRKLDKQEDALNNLKKGDFGPAAMVDDGQLDVNY